MKMGAMRLRADARIQGNNPIDERKVYQLAWQAPVNLIEASSLSKQAVVALPFGKLIFSLPTFVCTLCTHQQGGVP